jgi:hypothetical protein
VACKTHVLKSVSAKHRSRFAALSLVMLEIFLSDVSETSPNTYPNRGYNDPDYIDLGVI